jgi:hypothetical protein
MATWTTLPDASLEPGKPIRSIDGLALRDNPVAITEGATDAPRIVGKAAKRFADYPVLSVTAADTYSASIGSGDQPLATTTTSTTEVVAYRYTIDKYTGSLRFKTNQFGGVIQYYSGPEYATSTLRIFKNGTLITTYTRNGISGGITRTIDISIAPGDVIEWRHRTDNSLGGATITTTVVLGSDGYTTRELFLQATEANNV